MSSNKEINFIKTKEYFANRDAMKISKGLPKYFSINNSELGEKIKETIYRASLKDTTIDNNKPKAKKEDDIEYDEWDWC